MSLLVSVESYAAFAEQAPPSLMSWPARAAAGGSRNAEVWRGLLRKFIPSSSLPPISSSDPCLGVDHSATFARSYQGKTPSIGAEPRSGLVDARSAGTLYGLAPRSIPSCRLRAVKERRDKYVS